MSPRILLVTGSRVLEGSPEQGDALEYLRLAIARFQPTVIVAGDARGPDAWAVEHVAFVEQSSRPIALRLYSLDSWVTDEKTSTVRRWTTAEKFTPHDRNAAMVRDVAREQRKGAHVRVLGLEAAWSTTHGTAHTLDKARKAGLAITHITFERSEGQ
jgi:hypothetical protein